MRKTSTKNILFELWNLSRPMRRDQGIVILFWIFIIGLSLANTKVYQLFIDSIINLNGKFLTFGILLLVLTIIVSVLNFYAEYLLSLLQYRAIGQLWDRLFLALLWMDYTDIVQGKASKDMSKILSDSQIVGAMVGGIIPSIVINIVRLVGILAFMLYINYQLAFIAMLSLIPYYLVYKRISPALIEASTSEREAFEKAFESLREKVEGLTTIKKLGVSEYFHRNFLIQVETWISAIKKLILRERFYYFSTDAISSIMPVFILILGAFMVQRNIINLSVGSLLAFTKLSSGIYEPVSNISNNFAALSKGAPALNRVKTVLSVLRKRKEGALFEGRIARIDIIKGTKVGYSTPVLTMEGEFSFETGDRVIISGDSGSGKSTFVLALGGLLRIFSGDILINGRSVTKYDQDSLLSKISIVGPDEALFKGTLLENITLGKSIPEERLKRIVRICKLDLPLDFVIEAGGKNVSYGQRQRISLARALVKNPDVLILDEALSGIQLGAEEEILENLLAEYPNLIIFYISHRKLKEEPMKKFNKFIEVKNGIAKWKKPNKIPSRGKENSGRAPHTNLRHPLHRSGP